MKAAILAIVLFFALAGFCISAEERTTIHGTYISSRDSKEYLSLQPNGTFMLKQRKMPPDLENPFMEINGRYGLSGESLTLTLTDGGEASGKLKDNKFEDSDGVIWVKQGSEKPKPVERAISSKSHRKSSN